MQSVEVDYVLIKRDSKEQLQKIKNLTGKIIIVFGGAKFTCALINLGLVDELALAVCPVILGNGRSLFNTITVPAYFKLNEALTYNSGLVTLRYEVGKKTDLLTS